MHHSKHTPQFNMVSIQNATLAGGVAVGSSADLLIQPFGAILIGMAAGFISVYGYVTIQPKLAQFGLDDTCGRCNQSASCTHCCTDLIYRFQISRLVLRGQCTDCMYLSLDNNPNAYSCQCHDVPQRFHALHRCPQPARHAWRFRFDRICICVRCGNRPALR